MAWLMTGKTMRFMFVFSVDDVDDWLFAEETEEDCCISTVVFELIIFSWAIDVFEVREGCHKIHVKTVFLPNFPQPPPSPPLLSFYEGQNLISAGHWDQSITLHYI